MDALGLAIASVGATIVLVGLADAFLTVLPPDRDGRITAALNRAIWRAAVGLARVAPRARHRILGFAGPWMVISDVLLWMVLPILGYSLIIWPFLGSGFDVPPPLDADLWDAIYFSGVTFTTLGFGDITPVGRVWEILAIAEAITGFLVMSTSIAYIVAVFEGVDHRDALAMQVYSETDGTWSGAHLLARTLEEEGLEALRLRLGSWALIVRELHGRLYRFHGLALYVRTRGLDHGPERLLYALADVTLRAQVMTRSPTMRKLRPAADHVAHGVDHFASAFVRRHGSRAMRHAMDEPVPTAQDAERIRDLWRGAHARFSLDAPAKDPGEDAALLTLAARLRVFLVEVDRVTRWRAMAKDPRPEP